MNPSEILMTGDLVLVRGSRFPISLLIRLVTGSPFTHVAIAVTEAIVFEVDAFEKLQRKAMLHDDYIILRSKTHLSTKQKALLKQKMSRMERQSEGYDWRMIFSILARKLFKVPLRLEDPHRFICSEVVDRLYLEIGIDLLAERDEFVSPNEFLESEFLEIVYDSRVH